MNLRDIRKLRQTLAQLCIILMICLSVTSPGISFSSAIPYFKGEQLLLPVVGIMYVWMLLAGVARKIRFTGMFLVGLCYCISSAISIWYGADMLGHPVIIRDFYELPKLWLPIAFFTIAYEAELTERSLRRLMVFFGCAILLVCFYAYAQWLGLGVASKLNAYYSAVGGHNEMNLLSSRRVFATMGNPNFLGQLMTFCVAGFTLAFLFRVGNRVFSGIVAFGSLITLVMTGSRAGLLILTLGVMLISSTLFSLRRQAAAKLGLLFLLLPAFVWVYFTVASSNRVTAQRYQTLQRPLEIDSLRQRLDWVWLDIWSDFSESPIIGHGPAKAVFTLGYADTEYLGVLREKGIVGLLAYLGYFLYPLFLIQQGRRAAKRAGPSQLEHMPATLLALHFGYIIVVLSLVMNIAMGTFYTLQIQGFIWLWMGLSARASKTIADASRASSLVPAAAHSTSFQVATLPSPFSRY